MIKKVMIARNLIPEIFEEGVSPYESYRRIFEEKNFRLFESKNPNFKRDKYVPILFTTFNRTSLTSLVQVSYTGDVEEAASSIIFTALSSFQNSGAPDDAREWYLQSAKKHLLSTLRVSHSEEFLKHSLIETTVLPLGASYYADKYLGYTVERVYAVSALIISDSMSKEKLEYFFKGDFYDISKVKEELEKDLNPMYNLLKHYVKERYD